LKGGPGVFTETQLEETLEDRLRVYEQYRADLLTRQLSNSENFDKSVLTLSSAGLGFSLAFIKDIVPVADAVHPWLLYVSWVGFAIAIVSTLISFHTSQKAIDRHLEYAEEYYLQGKRESANKRSGWARATHWLGLLSASVFVLAVVLTILFVGLNLVGG
jgi:hypothetical protein